MNTSISLTNDELSLIEGGNPGLVAWLLAVAAGVTANYIYESVGGAQGINSGASSFADALSQATVTGHPYNYSGQGAWGSDTY